MFEKILIANRGEIACRVAATARRLGIKTVAIYSDADANAKHVAACDEAVHVGGSAPRDSYLQWQRILDAAKATGAQAIHPGYGFLSENEAFAQACADAGLVFIGPPPSAIEAMGLKAESKRLMEQAGVPLVPGYHGADQDAALLAREAGRIGYPVLIKASAGGGGKGMRVVEKADDFAAALASCQREAINSFGDQAVLIEKYVQRPRHIEIQVFADTQGHAVYLFERDCSVQRRHQKVLEEAPAPGMTEAMRRQMGEAAVAAAKAVGYVGAGTVEFIVEQRGETPSAATGRPEQASAPSGGSEDTSVPSVGADMRFFFMEMNTRLQVEHPVTEAITGLDLVEWQLRVAAGQPLPLAQDQLKIHGHAIEARICAESPDNDFLPATGTLAVYARPQATAFTVGDVRIDDGVEQGDAISPFYDSMIAKLIVHGDTREQALARLDAALAQVRIVGLAANVQFLRRVVRPGGAFARADLDTALIQRDREALFHQQPVAREQAVAIAVAHRLQGEQPAPAAVTVWTDPWAARDGFHSHAVAQRGFTFDVGGEPVRATLHYGRTLADGSALTLAVEDGAPQPLAFAPAADGAMRVDYAGRRTVAHVHRGADAQGQVLHVFTPAGAAQLSVVDPLARAGAAHAEGGQLTAPMPGKVVSFAVKAGDKVAKGQPLAVMEAMKMEHTIAAPADGEVEELLYAPGDQVAEGAALLRLQSA